MKELYRRLVLALFGKRKVTPSELGDLIATDTLSHLGISPTPFGSHDRVFWRLPAERQKQVMLESQVAHLIFFSHLFMKSAPDSAFAASTYDRYGSLIALRMAEKEELRTILGLGETRSSEAAYEELANAFYERGNLYFRILDMCPKGDYTMFARAHAEFIAPRQPDEIAGQLQSSAEIWKTLATAYRATIDRIWDNMTPAQVTER